MINGPSSLSKAAIEKKVAEYGGSVVQNPGKITHIDNFFSNLRSAIFMKLWNFFHSIASWPKCIHLVHNIYTQIHVLILKGSTTFCVLADKVVMRVTNLMKRDLYDIVKVDWFKRCLDAQTFIPWYDKINSLIFFNTVMYCYMYISCL